MIEIADRKERRLSFINLVEAFVLSAIRREHTIALPKVRKAMDYLRRTFKTHRPLADEQFATDGVDLFVEKFGALVSATQEGQVQLREIILDSHPLLSSSTGDSAVSWCRKPCALPAHDPALRGPSRSFAISRSGTFTKPFQPHE